MSVYYTDNTVKYVICLHGDEDHGYFASCNEAIINGEKKLLHNEVDFDFKMEDGKMHIFGGSHIGTEDFDFSEEEGDDCEHYIEFYHPGLLDQVKEMIRR